MVKTIIAAKQSPIFNCTIFKDALHYKRCMSIHINLFAVNIPKKMFREFLSTSLCCHKYCSILVLLSPKRSFFHRHAVALTILIDELLEPEEDAFALDTGEFAEVAHDIPKGVAALLAQAHEAIEAEGNKERHGDADVELHVDAAATLIYGIP